MDGDAIFFLQSVEKYRVGKWLKINIFIELRQNGASLETHVQCRVAILGCRHVY